MSGVVQHAIMGGRVGSWAHRDQAFMGSSGTKSKTQCCNKSMGERECMQRVGGQCAGCRDVVGGAVWVRDSMGM